MGTLHTPWWAIVAEARSADPWTSRARASFLYVMYTMILWSIPMGLIAAIEPKMATNVADGMNVSFAAIPESMWALFGTGYLDYTAARSWAKVRGFDNQQGSHPRWNGHSPDRTDKGTAYERFGTTSGR
jgi:ABC-type dipeptide/oligopeptide/nickel transport system permease component